MLKKKMRLDKYLCHIGYGTRSQVQKLVKQKRVSIDGVIINKPDYGFVVEEAEVMVDGKCIVYKEFYYFILHKPAGVITATKDELQETVLDLLESIDQNKEVAPVGRLDKDTEGLLILTNDGVTAHKLLSPKKHVPKVYYVEVEGTVNEEDQKAIEQGLTLADGTQCLTGVLDILEAGEKSKVHLTINEGKFHQVKRMMASLGKPVTYLKRVQMGGLKLPDDLEKGCYRELSEEELKQLIEGE